MAPNFDSDVLGIFSGEIERQDDPVITVRKKCLMAMETFYDRLQRAAKLVF